MLFELTCHNSSLTSQFRDCNFHPHVSAQKQPVMQTVYRNCENLPLSIKHSMYMKLNLWWSHMQTHTLASN